MRAPKCTPQRRGDSLLRAYLCGTVEVWGRHSHSACTGDGSKRLWLAIVRGVNVGALTLLCRLVNRRTVLCE